MNQYQKYILSEGKYRCNPSGLDIARDIAHGEKFGVVARKHHVPREVVYACVFALDIAAPIGAVQLAVFRILKRHWGGTSRLQTLNGLYCGQSKTLRVGDNLTLIAINMTDVTIQTIHIDVS